VSHLTLEYFGRSLLQHLKSGCKRRDLRFSDEQVDMLGHQYVSGDHELILLPDSFQFVLEDGVCVGSRQERKSVITTEGDEVETAGFLDSN
jgi:hypothetical protein